MEEKPNYYAIIPADVRYDKELKDKAKLLYGEIVALSNKDGYCYASNKYFAELYGVSTRTITELIRTLIDKEYIESELTYKKNTKEVLQRKIYLSKKSSIPIEKNFYTPIEENFQDNNTSINNTRKNKYIYMGTYKRIKLTEEQYNKLIDEFGENYIKQIIEKLDEYVESNNNKNKYSNYNLVIRKAIREKWFKVENLPDWFDKKIEKRNSTQKEQEEMKDLLKEFK